MRDMIIGLTGRNASGKTEVANYLRQMGYQYYSLSDAIRDEIRSRGMDISREVLIVVGNELRTRFGPGILAERVALRLREECNYVVDSIRNPAEVEALRRCKGFTLLAIKAEQSVRFERSRARGREGATADFEQFVREEAKELNSNDPASQQLLATERLADVVVNNNGKLDELQSALNELMTRLAGSVRRPDWDEYFMSIARVVASRSNCVKRKVAAIIVKDKRIVSTGYNGTPRGARNCNEGGCPRCNSMAPSGTALEECLCSHGEENAITHAAYHGTSLKGATLYTTFAPCLLCTKMIINSGIVEVVYNEEYPLNEKSMSLLRDCGIILRRQHL
jgi:dCMP deaminase